MRDRIDERGTKKRSPTKTTGKPRFRPALPNPTQEGIDPCQEQAEAVITHRGTIGTPPGGQINLETKKKGRSGALEKRPTARKGDKSVTDRLRVKGGDCRRERKRGGLQKTHADKCGRWGLFRTLNRVQRGASGKRMASNVPFQSVEIQT